MKKKILEGITHIKECNKVCCDIAIMLDDGLLDEQVYDQDNVMDALHLFFHVAGNYTAGKALQQGCSVQFCERQAEEFGNALHSLMKEFVKIDTRNYYK